MKLLPLNPKVVQEALQSNTLLKVTNKLAFKHDSTSFDLDQRQFFMKEKKQFTHIDGFDRLDQFFTLQRFKYFVDLCQKKVTLISYLAYPNSCIVKKYIHVYRLQHHKHTTSISQTSSLSKSKYFNEIFPSIFDYMNH